MIGSDEVAAGLGSAAGDAVDAAALDRAAAAASAGMAPPAGAEGQPSTAAAPPPLSTADVLGPLIGAGFRIVAPAWGVSEAEARDLAGAWAPVLDKYFPGGIALSVEFNAAIVTLALIGPRWGKPRQLPAPAATPPPGSPAADGGELRTVGK